MGNETVVAVPRVVLGPETLDSGARKWTVALENGSQLATFSEKAFNAVNGNLDVELTFEVETNDKGWAPKITKILKAGELLYEPGQGTWQPRGGGRDEGAETARRAVGSAVAIVSSWQAAEVAAGKTPFKPAEMVTLIGEMAPSIFTQMKDLEKENG